MNLEFKQSEIIHKKILKGEFAALFSDLIVEALSALSGRHHGGIGVRCEDRTGRHSEQNKPKEQWEDRCEETACHG